MRSLEHSRGIDQAHVADDRNNIETSKHSGGTSWDDLKNVPFRGNDPVKAAKDMKALIDSLPKIEDDEEINTAVENIKNSEAGRAERLRLTDEELIELTAEWDDVEIDEEALRKATERNGNPNSYAPGLPFSYNNLPTSSDSVYRRVGTSAISDLMIVGFVRNKRESENALDKPGKTGYGTSGPTVYWNGGTDGGSARADLLIQASKAAAEKGYVTKDDVQGIWVTDKATGQPVNLIDGQDHTGLEIAPHRL